MPSKRTGVEQARIPTAGLPGHTADFAEIYIARIDGEEVFRSPFRDEAERRLQQHVASRAQRLRHADAPDTQ